MSLLDDVSIVVTPNGYKAGELYAVIPSDGAADMDVTRATDATRVDENGLIEDVLANVPRIDYTGGGCPHILAEPQRTNEVTYSEDFTQWTSSVGMTVTLNDSTSPSGNLNATLLATSNANDLIYTSVSTTIASTLSVYVKWKVGIGNIDLSSDGGYNYTSLPVTEGWTRISISPTTIANQIVLKIPTSGSELYIWGLQLEEGSYATSYIPTSGSTVTRNQDIFTRDGIGSLINSTEGVLFVEMAALQTTNTNAEYLVISDGTYTANSIMIQLRSGANQLAVWGYSGSVYQIAETITLTDITDFNKIAIKWKLNDFEVFVNGSSVYSLATYTAPTGLDRIEFSRNGTAHFYGKVKQLQVYKTALTDTQLAALTS